MRKKKYKLSEITTILIDASLEQYGIDSQWLIDNNLNGTNWFQKYTWNSMEEYQCFKQFALYLIKNHYKKLHSHYINDIWSAFDLQFGLSLNFQYI